MAGERPDSQACVQLAMDSRLSQVQDIVRRGWNGNVYERPTSAEVLSQLNAIV